MALTQSFVLAVSQKSATVLKTSWYKPRGKKEEFVALILFGTGDGYRTGIRSGFGRNAKEACGAIEAREPGARVLAVTEHTLEGVKKLKAEALKFETK